MEFQTLSFYKTLRTRLVLTFPSYLRIFLFSIMEILFLFLIYIDNFISFPIYIFVISYRLYPHITYSSVSSIMD